MIRKRGVAAIGSFPPRHVAGKTIGGACGVILRKRGSMTAETTIPEVCRRVQRLVMRIMAGGAPHAAAARDRAPAARQLFGLANHPKRSLAGFRGCRDIGGKNTLQR